MTTNAPRLDSSAGEKSCRQTVSCRNLKHELRTPLNHIIGYCEMLIEQAEDDVGLSRFTPDLDHIHSAGKRLLNVIDDLCDRLGRNALTEAAVQHELRTPLNHVIGYAELLQEEAREIDRDEFVADLEKVHRAGRDLFNLVLENFFPAEPDLSHTGSSVTTFAREQAAFKPLTKGPAVPPDEHASLLVVDDNELNRDMLKRRLERLGYSVTCAVNGAEALEKLKAEPFDLLLLDVLMPVMNGFEVLAHLKDDARQRDIPVIVLSASDQLDHAVNCIEMGASDYVMKPFNPVLLQARIGSCLERKRLHDQETLYLQQIEQEKQRSDELLHVILPRDIAAELKTTASVKPRRFDKVGILFCDIVEFTAYSARRRPEEILLHLQTLVEAFEQLALKHDLEKIKTIGDSFMATAGLMGPLDNPALNCVRCGLEMIASAQKMPAKWQVRVGVHVGPVIAGVVGHRKYQYDVWGDAVNIASRVEQAAIPGSVCVNKDTWTLIAERSYGRSIGQVRLKGKGEQELFIIDAVAD